MAKLCPHELIFNAIVPEFDREADSVPRILAEAFFEWFRTNRGFGLRPSYQENGPMSAVGSDFVRNLHISTRRSRIWAQIAVLSELCF